MAFCLIYHYKLKVSFLLGHIAIIVVRQVMSITPKTFIKCEPFGLLKKS